ncbi:hypothetical protein HPB48_015265 [Haemaphysalis longicornis]|uniref:TRAF1-6 MATH domain-containing protein n=1 Tax=Haemaphysalis longicornis TaxID=44386 RepID=A0A9J6FUZ2_HAELO|nr:hypothetical protein HPB48_015265 [Haemaphysalis longicornis]
MMVFERKVEQQVRKLDSKLAQLSLESGSQHDKLVEISHSINHLKEALMERVRQASDRNLAEMKALYAEKSDNLRTTLSSLLAPVQDHPKTHQRVITGYASYKEKAMKNGWSNSIGDKVYLERYLISLGIEFRKEGDNVNLSVFIQLHEGKEDACLDWPFRNELKLSVIHPETREERHICVTPYLCEDSQKYFSRPIDGSNRAVRFADSSIESSDLEREGYVKKDQLLIRFEVH